MSLISLLQRKSETNMNNLFDKNELANKELFINYLLNGCKAEKDYQTGLEFEKLAVKSADCRAVSYYGENGIRDFIITLKQKFDWEYICEQANPLGLNTPFGSITLEPGSQIELSSIPQNTIHDIKKVTSHYNTITAEIAESYGISFIGYGIQPITTNVDIKTIPKARYEIMTEYLPKKASLPFVMMKETAGIQSIFDYSSEKDCIDKLRTALMLSPFVTAIFANSPIRNGSDTGYKSYRAHSWLNTDEDRCGLISRNLFDKGGKDFSFSEYADIIFNLPMMFLKKDDIWQNMNGMRFNDHLKNQPLTMDDLMLHLTSFFPEVRLKHYLEIRNNDCQTPDFLYAIPALWKGIIYSDDARAEVQELLSSFSYKDFKYLRENVPKYGLQTTIKNSKVADYAKQIIALSELSLNKMNNKDENNNSESIYLENIKELVDQEMSPADLILKNWYGYWDKNVLKLLEYSKII